GADRHRSRARPHGSVVVDAGGHPRRRAACPPDQGVELSQGILRAKLQARRRRQPAAERGRYLAASPTRCAESILPQAPAPLLDVVAEATTAMLGRWERIAAAEEAVDVAREMTKLTLTITGQVLFGVDLTDEAAEIGGATAILMEHTKHRF